MTNNGGGELADKQTRQCRTEQHFLQATTNKWLSSPGFRVHSVSICFDSHHNFSSDCTELLQQICQFTRNTLRRRLDVQ